MVFVPWLSFFTSPAFMTRADSVTISTSLKRSRSASIINALIAILFFYFIPAFGIAPKTNLFIFFVVFAVIEILWRRAFNYATRGGEAPNRGDPRGRRRDRRGYRACHRGKSPARLRDRGTHIRKSWPRMKPQLVSGRGRDLRANIVAVPRYLKREGKLLPVLYDFIR